MRPGKVQKTEFEYIRHGTQTLIANFDVATGKIMEPTCGDTKTEEDFAQHIRRTIETDPDAKKWNLIMDCLNGSSVGVMLKFKLILEICLKNQGFQAVTN
jgi:putative transposase